MSDDSVVDSALVNTGLQLINADDEAIGGERTVIVLGVARSGTTMIAGALQQLGVDMMGGRRPNTVFEDVVLGQAMEVKDYSKLSQLIAERNRLGPVWGWKRPSALTYMARVERYFRSPRYVVVFRDLLAIANRNRISVRADLLDNLYDTAEHYRRLLAFVRKSARPMLLVSYEKAMLNRQAFVDALSAFAGEVGHDRRDVAEKFICTNADTYLASARNWSAQGEISTVEADRVMGWAFVPGSSDAVAVRLIINGRLFGTQLADLPRPSLVDRKMHPTGCCGYNFRLPQHKRLRDGDRVSVRVVGESRELGASPQRYVSPE